MQSQDQGLISKSQDKFVKTEKLDTVNLKFTRNQLNALESKSALEGSVPFKEESSLNEGQKGAGQNKKVGRAIFYS